MYSFTPRSSDTGGGDPAYSIQNKPGWAIFSISTGQLTGIPTSADVGTYQNIQIKYSTGPATATLPSFSIQVVPHGSLDAYGGVSASNCTNPNGTAYFGLATVSSHKVLCDPAGHPYFGRGFYVFDDAALGNDETGNSYNSYVTAKYGTTDTSYTWDTAEVARMKSWGFNMIGPDSSAYAMASWPWVGGGTNPNKVPFVLTDDACFYSWSNRNGWGTAPVKDVLSTASPFWHGTGYTGYQGVTDYEDPAWVSYVKGMLSSSGDENFANVLSASGTDKSYLIGIIGCDTDYTHGFDGGPDFDTAPSGNNDFRLSYEVALGSPVEWASTHQHQIYTDSTVYSKYDFYSQLVSKYANIAALNSVWGSSYSTFGTSGTCYGSGFATWICPSPSAAPSIGTGDGSTLNYTATLSGVVSANSLGIFVSGVLVGGDGGDGPFSGTSGTIYGPHMTGTINYSTGALKIAFASGSAPIGGASITAEYIANGWGVGSGVMDEDGRAAHQSWTGSNSVCIDDVGTTHACGAGGGNSYASAGMVTDLNLLDKTLAARFASTYKNAIVASFPGALFLGPQTFGTWNVPPNRYVLQGMGPSLDIGVLNSSGGAGISQAELDFVHQYAGDLAVGLSTYSTANLDSPFAWPNSSCSHSGATVTCTVSAPLNFSTSWSIKTNCTDPSYNVNGISPSYVGTSSISYTGSRVLANATTVCTVSFGDINVPAFPTVAARATAIGSQMQGLPGASYSSDGIHPYVLSLWWQWSDKQDEELSWGVVDTRDNAYNGAETTTSKTRCSAPLESYPCGGELRGGWGSDDGITPLVKANGAIDDALAAIDQR
ncbi:MAG TPA: hypothetical protein VN660_02210 [Steroidobacteraceae bacterium]|nr:hypothetical protein [Steroidobacteraceae bacterium]